MCCQKYVVDFVGSVFNFVRLSLLFFLANKKKISASPELHKLLNLEPRGKLIPHIFFGWQKCHHTQDKRELLSESD